MVVSTRHKTHVVLDQSILEMCVESWCSRGFGEISNPVIVDIGVLGKWNVDEGHVEMFVGVMAVRIFETISGRFEPIDLIWLQPVVASVVRFVGRIGMGVEQVKRKCGMFATMSLDLDEVVADTIDSVRARLAQGVR